MVTMYDLITTYAFTPSNDIEQLVAKILAGALYVLAVFTIPYIIIVISQLFRR